MAGSVTGELIDGTSSGASSIANQRAFASGAVRNEASIVSCEVDPSRQLAGALVQLLHALSASSTSTSTSQAYFCEEHKR